MKKLNSSQKQRLKYLHLAEKKALKIQSKLINDPVYDDEKTYLENLKAYLENMQESQKRFIDIQNGKRNPIVGVFGCPSKGKSTLINVLLGAEILPMSVNVGTTRFGTELSYTNTGKKEEPYKVKISYINKVKPPLRLKTEEDVNYQLGFISENANEKNPDITKIVVEGPFKSFIGNDIVFIDTPGVEIYASKKDLSEDDNNVENDFVGDRERALAVLSNVDIVIYCMSLKCTGERKDVDFYKKYIKDKFETINVITASDKREEEQDNKKIKLAMMKYYELVIERTVAVSPFEALEFIKEQKKKNKNIAKLRFSEKDENLTEFNDLKDKIRARVGRKDSDFREERIVQFEELYNIIRDDAQKRKIELPDLKNPKGFISIFGRGVATFFKIVIILAIIAIVGIFVLDNLENLKFWINKILDFLNL